MKRCQIVLSIMLVMGICSCRKVNIPLAEPVPEAKPVFNIYDGQLGISDNSAIVTYDNNIVICGNLGKQVLVFKISKSGALIWKKLINPGRGSTASGIAETKDHELVICGHTDINYDQFRADMMLIKVSETGDSVWTKTYGGTENDTAYNIISTSDGNLLVAAKTESFGSYDEDIYLMKLTTDGNEIWAKKLAYEYRQSPFHVIETKEGGYLVSGTDEDQYTDPFKILGLMKVNANGEVLWRKTVFSSITGCSTVESANGDLLTCGSHFTFNNSVFLHKTNSSGDVIWQQELMSSTFAFISLYSIRENIDHSYVLTGYFKPSPNAKRIVLFMKVNNKGELVFERKFGDPIDNTGLNLLKDTNGDNLIIGHNASQIFLTRIGPDGSFK